MFFYNENSPGANSQVNVWKMNGTKAYLRHYENLLFLQFVSTNPRAGEVEKRQARKEIVLCEKKLAFWYRHPLYDHEEALRGIDQLKKNWRSAA